MLKRIAHIVLGFLLIVATSGFTISRHYCGNHLLSVSIFKSDNCCGGGQCDDCHTSVKFVKVTDNFATPDVIHSAAPTTSDLYFQYKIEFSTCFFQDALRSFMRMEARPPGQRNPFAFFQSFRC